MLYHLTINGGLNKLTPKIPGIAISQYENTTIKRICFSDSINGCLSALQSIPSKYFVYTLDENVEDQYIHIPTVDEVRDAKYTHEVWILREVDVRCLGIIQSQNYDYSKRHNSGRGRVTIYHYPYKWVKQY